MSQRPKTLSLSVKQSSFIHVHTIECPNHLPTSFSIAFGSEIDCANGSRFLFVSSTVANIFTFSGSSSASKLMLMIVPSLATSWQLWDHDVPRRLGRLTWMSNYSDPGLGLSINYMSFTMTTMVRGQV